MFAALSYTSEENELLKPRLELEQKLLDLMLQGCIMDLKESGQLLRPFPRKKSGLKFSKFDLGLNSKFKIWGSIFEDTSPNV